MAKNYYTIHGKWIENVLGKILLGLDLKLDLKINERKLI